MADPSPFVQSLVELMTPLGEVKPKRMFGGHGLFVDGIMFALVTGAEVLHLKADEHNRDAFIARGAVTHGKMPYYSVPPEDLQSWDEIAPWATGALEAARRGKKK